MKRNFVLVMIAVLLCMPVYADITDALEKRAAEEKRAENNKEIQALLELPGKMLKLTEKSREEARKVLNVLKEGSIPVEETAELLDTMKENEEMEISNEGLGDFVQKKLQEGKKGKELSEVIHQERSRRRGEEHSGKGSGQKKSGCTQEQRRRHGCKDAAPVDNEMMENSQKQGQDMIKKSEAENEAQLKKIQEELRISPKEQEKQVLEIKKKAQQQKKGGKR